MKIIDKTNDKIILYENQKIFVVWIPAFRQAVNFDNAPTIIGWHSFILNEEMDKRKTLDLTDQYGNRILNHVFDLGLNHEL